MGTAARRRALGAGGVLALLAAWQLLASAAPASTVPAPLAIVAQAVADGPDFYLRNLGATLSSAGLGWLWGNGLAVLSGLALVLVRRSRSVILQLAVASYCLPIVAIGPILSVTFGGTTPQVILAALAVYLPTLVGIDAGLRTTSTRLRQVVAGFGGTSAQELAKVRWRAALPGLFSGLKIAAPSAFLGALIGEYLGANQGLGVAMVSAQQSFQVERTWALAIVGTAAAGLGYALTALAARILVPWASEVDIGDAALEAQGSGGSAVRVWTGALGSALGSMLVLLVVWQGGLWLLQVDPFIGKGPWQVVEYLFLQPDAETHRAVLWDASIPTIAHAVIGLVSGGLAAIVVSCVFVLAPAVESVLFPIAMALRSVPLVALTPLIAITFGRDLLGVSVVTGIVTFFPTLSMLGQALRATPATAVQLGVAYGASPFTVLRKIQFIHALPTLFAALRTTAPLALTGALLAEWLFTGDGLGYLMLLSQTSFDIGQLWSAVALVTIYSLVFYGAVGLAERAVAGWLNPQPRSSAEDEAAGPVARQAAQQEEART